MERNCWYPLKDRGVYTPVEYADDGFLNPEFVCDTEDDCQEMCDKLNEDIDNSIKVIAQKCFNGILKAEKKYNIDRRFLIPKLQSMFENIKTEAERIKE